MRISVRMLVVICALVAAAGCRLVEPRAKGRSPLIPLTGAPDTVTLEIFSAPVGVADPRVDSLWSEVDEQSFDPRLRSNLRQNGIRVGIVGPHVPDVLAEMLKVTDQRVAERSAVALDTEPGVILRVLQPRLGHRNELVVCDTRESVAVLWAAEGHVDGKTYSKAECQLALRVLNDTDSSARLELVPELHYGEVKAHAVGSDGVFMWKPERSKQIFHELKLSAKLGAGQMLLITAAHDKPGSVGHTFFALPGAEKPMQKLWVIRMAQAGPDRSFVDELKVQAADISSDSAE
jgi:hypothetical protein